jgi:alanine dehydrogenase
MMIIGVPKEIKNNENRVSATPAGAYTLTKAGHTVLIEETAGAGSGFPDADYSAAGAKIVSRSEVFTADMIIKVKEPLAEEYDLLKPGQILFTYLHLAANRTLTEKLLDRKVVGIAYETIQAGNKSLPLLTPMSEVAGRMAVQVGASLLQKYNGGMGILLGGVPGVLPGEVVIIGGGVVGTNAARMAVGLGARVTVLDISQSRLAYLDDVFGGRINTLLFNDYALGEMVKKADLLIGAVLIMGAKAPKTVTEEMVKTMKSGSVIVDVAIDQGGTIATIDRVTTHDNPCYEKYGVIHYSVANMPGAVPRTSTQALTGATLPYALALADKGFKTAMKDDFMLKAGLNTCDGQLTCKAVADSFDMIYTPAESVLQ